jgi:MoxR-like ATPase
MAAAKEIAADANAELVVYRPGVVRDPNKNQVLFVHMSMAGMTSGGVLGFPTVSSNDRVDANDSASTKLEKQRRFVSQQVIPEIWRSAMEFEQAIYLFDEITHVISQEAMLSLLSEGFYGETELAKRTLFIATANEGVADGTLQQKLSTAFRNRFTAYYIGASRDFGLRLAVPRPRRKLQDSRE